MHVCMYTLFGASAGAELYVLFYVYSDAYSSMSTHIHIYLNRIILERFTGFYTSSDGLDFRIAFLSWYVCISLSSFISSFLAKKERTGF